MSKTERASPFPMMSLLAYLSYQTNCHKQSISSPRGVVAGVSHSLLVQCILNCNFGFNVESFRLNRYRVLYISFKLLVKQMMPDLHTQQNEHDPPETLVETES